MHLRSKTVQQLLSVILSVVMVLSMLPMEVLAQETPPVTTPMDLTAITEDTSGDGWSWTQSTKTLTLTGLTLTVSDDSTHALILPDGATIDLADGTTSTLTGGSRSTVYSSGEVKLRGSGSLTVYGRGWRSATLDMFIPGTLTVEYDDPDGGAVLKTDEGTEGAAICANVTLDNGILRATGPDFASADDGSSVGLRGRLTTHGSSVEAQLTARTGYASYGLYFDKQGSGRGDTWTMGLGKVTAAAGHALSRYSYGLYVDYSSVNALELDGTQLTAMGGESDQYGSQGVFAGEEIIVKNGATVTATGGQVNSSYESVGFNAISWLTVSGENSRVLGYGGTSVKGDSKGVRCDSRFTLTDGCVFGQGGVSCTSSRNVGVEFKRLIMESGKLEGISGSPDSSYQTWGGQFNAYGLYCTGTAKITGGELIGTANGTDRELDYSAYGFYGSDELTMSGGTLRATTGDTPNASSGTLAALSVVSNKSKTQLSGGTIYARAGVSNDDRSYGMRILGTGSTLTMTNTEDAAQPLSLYVTGRNMALYATALADGGLLPEITASSAYDAEADTLTDGYTFSNKQYRKDGTAALSLSAAACLHSASDDTGLCTKCGKRVYEAVLLTDGAVTQRYAAAGEAFTAAQTEEHQGCTLRLLTDLIDDGQPLVHDPVVTITGGRFTLDLRNHTIAGKTSDDKEGVVTVTGGQLRIENGTLENLCTGNGSKAQALTLLGTDTHVTLANVTAIGATPPNGDTSASVYAPDGARLTIESGEFTGRVAGTYASAPTETPHVSIAGGTFHNGLSYSIHETEANAATLLAILKEGYALAHADGTPVDLGTEPSFSRFSGTYTLSSEVQVVAHTHNVRSGRPGYCGCGYACPHDGQMPDSYFTLPVCSLCGVSYGTPLKDLRTPTGKIIIDENNWWQDFLNTVTVDGQPATAEGSLYTLPADNVSHEIVAVDVAGNRTTVTVSVYRVYTVTPPTGTGFTFTGETTVRHGQDYRFRVDIAPGYSKLPDYSLLVNGQTPGGMGDVDFDECLIPSVEGDLTITVTGVADITPPEAELTIAGNPFRQFLNTVTFGLFFKSTQTVTVTASDLGSGVDTAAWMLSDTVFASQDAITGSWTDLSLTDGSGSFSIQPGQKGYAYLRVTDRAGNITVLNSDGVVVYTDAQADTRQITYVKRSGQDVSFHVALNGNTVTGVQLADGTPLAGFTAAEDGTVTLPAATLQALAAGDYTLYVTYAPLGVAYNARYEASEAPAMTSVALSVQKAEGSVAILDDVSRDYNGQPVETPAITSLGTGALTVEYRAQGGEFTTQAPKAVGSYTVRVTAAADDDYASASAQRNFRITAKSVTIDGVTVEPSKTYDGTTDAAIVTGGTLSANFDGNDLRIVTGSAAYDGKNVGTGKTVFFSGFSLEGDAAENYTLASQPAGTTADITVRTVTVEDLHIQDKLYDGTDRAEYDGEPTLGNAVSGDHVALVKGTPSFTSIRTAEDIAIRFTEFSLTGADAGNYALTQPTGITASILPYALTGGEYAVNSNDWINHDFVVTAAEGYLLSLTDTADGVWQQTLRATDETAEGRLTFYVKDLATGAISLQVTEQYRIDRTQPTGEIRVDERTAWQSFLSRITFGLFYREEQPVVITSADETSGVAATEYLLSAEDLDIPALEQETFLPYEKALALAPDGEYVVYARITDRAGNVTCLRSDGMVLDATAPAITGAENGGVYCAAVTLTITDAYPVTVTLNGAPVELTEGRLALRPAEGTQLVTATDPAGNESRLEITVNDGHTWGDWSSNGDDTHTRTCTISGCGALETESCTGGEATCVDRAVCEVCGGAYGDVDAHRHADLRHVEAKTATTEAPGNIEYWYCAACGKYFADAQASRELQQADTVTEKLPAAPTGDEAPLTLWVIVLAACAGLALLLLVLRRRNSHRTA